MKINNFFIFGNEYIDYLESEKNTRQLVWYEKLYIWYYNNFEYIIIIIGFAFLGFIFYNDYYVKHTTSYKLQSGGSTGDSPNETPPPPDAVATTPDPKVEPVAAAPKVESEKAGSTTGSTAVPGGQEAVVTAGQEAVVPGTPPVVPGTPAVEGPGGPEPKKKGILGKTKSGLVSATKSAARSTSKGAKFGKASYGKMKSMGSFAGSKITSAGSTLKNTFMSHTGDMYKLFFTVFLTFAIGVFILPTLVLAMLGFLTFLITKKHLTKLFTM